MLFKSGVQEIVRDSTGVATRMADEKVWASYPVIESRTSQSLDFFNQQTPCTTPTEDNWTTEKREHKVLCVYSSTECLYTARLPVILKTR